MRKEIDWREYERRKKLLGDFELSAAEYERQCRQIVEDLDSESDDEEVAA